jgi:putative transcriptional regulator
VRPVHHPSEAILADYASGALADGPSLVVSAHLERCPGCRKATRLFEAIGGEWLDALPPTPMRDDALPRALTRIDRPAPAPKPSIPRLGPEGLVLPRALAARRIGRRRFVAPGYWIAPVPSKHADGWRTYLLRAPPGMGVPHHGHNGAEYTVVLRGAVLDGEGHYTLGDFSVRDETEAHQPQAEGPDPCICLITGQGGLKAHGPILRLLQPLLGI